MARLNLSPPWCEFYEKVNALFEFDPEVKVVFDDGEEKEITLYVDNSSKADALSRIIPESVTFGNIKLNVKIVPGNGAKTYCSNRNDYDIAFNCNDAFAYSEVVPNFFAGDITYVVFKNRVVQYFNDNIFDINGVASTLYENIARDVFVPREDVFFCTDLPD